MTAFERTLGPSASSRDDAAALRAMMTGVLYGEWLRTRLYIAASIALGLGAAYGFGVLDRVAGGQNFEAGFYVATAMFIAEFLLFGVLLYSFDGRDRMVASLPSMTLRHPMPTWALVAVRFGFGVVAVAAVTGALGSFWSAAGLTSTPVAMHVARYVFLYAVLQSLAYGTFRVGDWSVPILLATVAMLYAIHLWRTQHIGLFASWGTSSAMGIAAVSMVLGYGAGVASVKRQRTTGDGARPAAGAHSRTALLRKTFHSRESAQFWLECRRTKTIMVRCVVGAVLVWAALNALSKSYYSENAPLQLVQWLEQLRMTLLPATCVGVALAGVVTALQSRRRVTGVDRIFDYGRPVPTVLLVRNRLRTALAVVGGMGFVISFLSIALGWLAIDAYVKLPNAVYTDAGGLVARLVLVSFVGIPAFFWAAHWGGLSLTILAVGIASIGLVEYVSGGSAARIVFEMGAPGAAICLVGGALFLVGRRLLPISHVVLAVVLAAMGANAMPFIDVEIFKAPHQMMPVPSETKALFFCVLFAPVVWTPYWLERNRHK